MSIEDVKKIVRLCELISAENDSATGNRKIYDAVQEIKHTVLSELSDEQAERILKGDC